MMDGFRCNDSYTTRLVGSIPDLADEKTSHAVIKTDQILNLHYCHLLEVFSTGSQLHQNFFFFFRNMTVANKSSMYCMFLFLQIVFEVRLLCTCAACGSWWSICALTHDTLIECFSLWSTLIDCD